MLSAALEETAPVRGHSKPTRHARRRQLYAPRPVPTNSAPTGPHASPLAARINWRYEDEVDVNFHSSPRNVELILAGSVQPRVAMSIGGFSVTTETPPLPP